MRGGPVSRILCRTGEPVPDDHSSGPPLAERLKLPTRTPRAEAALRRYPRKDQPARGPYLALLPVGLAMRVRLPVPRWALTPPFHPGRRFPGGGLFSVALSVRLPCPGVTRHRCLRESGLSSLPRPLGMGQSGRPALRAWGALRAGRFAVNRADGRLPALSAERTGHRRTPQARQSPRRAHRASGNAPRPRSGSAAHRAQGPTERPACAAGKADHPRR
ncbi:hypothetical protein FIU97_12680 [Roseivivax sp. THAF40]|nr:hypothetical protein FIV09_12360 [Roseivivax sp. THAF197b]QFT47429.1 hypothetical protein FIU97_12680 [Roseivivax sp. THAF40]